jgi:peroxidase
VILTLRRDFLRKSLIYSLQVISSLKRVYATVGDIDLYIGGVTEKPLPGAVVGPTFHYIIGQQFDNLRRTDRFFYDDLTKSVSFNLRKNRV